MIRPRKANALQEQGAWQSKSNYSDHNHISILERHFCYCRPGIPCIFCLTWNRLIRRIESREVVL